MAIMVHFTSSPVTEVWGNGCFISLPMSNVLPSEQHLCASTAEVADKLADWKERVKATGKPAVVCCFKAHRQPAGARKPAGFDKVTRGHCLLNANAAKQREVA